LFFVAGDDDAPGPSSAGATACEPLLSNEELEKNLIDVENLTSDEGVSASVEGVIEDGKVTSDKLDSTSLETEEEVDPPVEIEAVPAVGGCESEVEQVIGECYTCPYWFLIFCETKI
jgi:hypothetical protein